MLMMMMLNTMMMMTVIWTMLWVDNNICVNESQAAQ